MNQKDLKFAQKKKNGEMDSGLSLKKFSKKGVDIQPLLYYNNYRN